MAVGWVERSETHRCAAPKDVMGFASLNPSYEADPHGSLDTSPKRNHLYICTRFVLRRGCFWTGKLASAARLLLKTRLGVLYQRLSGILLQNPLQKQQTAAGLWPKALRSAGSWPEIIVQAPLFSTR